MIFQNCRLDGLITNSRVFILSGLRSVKNRFPEESQDQQYEATIKRNDLLQFVMVQDIKSIESKLND